MSSMYTCMTTKNCVILNTVLMCTKHAQMLDIIAVVKVK